MLRLIQGLVAIITTLTALTIAFREFKKVLKELKRGNGEDTEPAKEEGDAVQLANTIDLSGNNEVFSANLDKIDEDQEADELKSKRKRSEKKGKAS